MSDTVSALNHATSHGFATVQEQGLRGMITLRGDLASAGFQKAVKAAVGTDVPGQRAILMSGEKGAAWMSPDELLLLLPYDQAEATVAQLSADLAGEHALAANVSDARVVFKITGEGTREVLAKIAPVDLSRAAFGAGQIRRSRVAQVAAAFWVSGPEEFTLVAFRSVADYVFKILTTSAETGSEVGIL